MTVPQAPRDGAINYRSVADLERAVLRAGHRLPEGLDLVVGLPRSGLLAAALVALQRNLRFTDLDGYLSDRVFASGRTKAGAMRPAPVTRAARVKPARCCFQHPSSPHFSSNTALPVG